MELIYVLIGVVIGSIITNILHARIKSCGTLEINYSDPERDMYRLVIRDDLESLAKKKCVELKVHVSQN